MTTTEPEQRRRHENLDGTPVEINGQTWILADFIPELGDAWNRLYDHNIVRGQYDPKDVQLGALRLLMANYHLTLDEAVALVLAVDPAELVQPVEVAIFGVDRPYRGYSEWVESSLYINGIDPASVPASKRRDVVAYLVTAGKAIPAEQYLSSYKAAAKRQGWLDLAARHKPAEADGDGQEN